MFEADVHTGAAGHVVGILVGGEGTSVVDHKVRFAKCFQLFISGADQHVVHEQGVIGTLGDHTDLDTSLGGGGMGKGRGMQVSGGEVKRCGGQVRGSGGKEEGGYR